MRLAQQRLAANERAFGYDDLPVAAELQFIGALHHEAANYGEALGFYGAALGIQERRLGPDHPAVAATLRDIAAARSDELEAPARIDQAMRGNAATA